jgi:hypothetical protein
MCIHIYACLHENMYIYIYTYLCIGSDIQAGQIEINEKSEIDANSNYMCNEDTTTTSGMK